ncbi:MAG: hypothetical protein UV78_C0044G0001, partial [Parcubacteria group bacterium GW2011_GWA2_43_17]
CFNHSGIYAFAQDYGSLSFPNAKHWGLTRRVVKSEAKLPPNDYLLYKPQQPATPNHQSARSPDLTNLPNQPDLVPFADKLHLIVLDQKSLAVF